MSTSLKKKRAQGGHLLTQAQPGTCLMPHPLSSTGPPPLTPALALGSLGSRMPSSEGSRHLESRSSEMPSEEVGTDQGN